jgi:hypothetical protein
MSDYRVDRLSIEKIERFASDFLVGCPKLPNGCEPKWCNQAARRGDFGGVLSLAALQDRARAFQ